MRFLNFFAKSAIEEGGQIKAEKIHYLRRDVFVNDPLDTSKS